MPKKQVVGLASEYPRAYMQRHHVGTPPPHVGRGSTAPTAPPSRCTCLIGPRQGSGTMSTLGPGPGDKIEAESVLR